MARSARRTRPFRLTAGALSRYGRSHRRWLAIGLVGTLGVVLARLMIPWPLRWALDLVQPGDAPPPLAGADGSVLPIALAYVAIAVVLGVS